MHWTEEYFPTCACVLNCFSHVWLFATLWTVACQVPLSMGFYRQVYWSGLPHLPPWDLPAPGIEPVPLTSPPLAGRFFTTSATWEAHSQLDDQLTEWKGLRKRSFLKCFPYVQILNILFPHHISSLVLKAGRCLLSLKYYWFGQKLGGLFVQPNTFRPVSLPL